jgi:hypothetical protein
VNATGDYAITLQGHAAQKPSEQDVLAYVAQRYPGARVLDADTSYPGNKISVVIHLAGGFQPTAQNMIPIHSPETPIEDRPEGAGLYKEFVDDKFQAQQAEALERNGRVLIAIASENPKIDLFETAIETDANSVTSHFAIYQGGVPAFLREANGGVEITQVLSPGAAPAVGYIVASFDGTVRAALHGPKGEVAIHKVRRLLRARDDMFSPESLPHEDEPGAYEHGSWVTKADAMPATGDVAAEGAPPAPTKGQWDREMARYRDMEQARLFEEERNRQRRLMQPPRGPMPAPPAGTAPWLETKPLHEQVGEHLGGPGLAVAERAAADKATEEYWQGYFDESPTTEGYGEALTRDVERKKQTKAMVVEAWKAAGRRITAAELLQAMRILTGESKQAQVSDDLAGALSYARTSDPSAAAQVDKLVADFLARNPEELDRLGVYDQALNGAVRYWEAMQPKRLERLRQRYAPGETPVETAGGPGLGTRLLERMDPSRRLQREVETGAHGPMPTEPELELAREQPFQQPVGPPGAPRPAPAAPAEPSPFRPKPPGGGGEPLDLGEFGFEPGKPAAPPEAGTPARERRRKPREPYAPEPGMQVFDDRGQPVSGAPEGVVLTKFPSGAVRYKGHDGQRYTAYPPGAETPAGRAGPPPAAPPAKPKSLLERLRGAGLEREAYKPLSEQYDADNPTPGSYHDQSATDNYAGRNPPASAALGFKLENLRRSGDYVVGDVVWDAERTKAMSSKNVEHNIISYVKGRSTMKDPFDMGNIGRVRVRKLDVHAGVAEVIFRSSEGRVFPPEQIIVDEGVVHHDPLS